MLEAMDSNTEKTGIYMPLLNEGVPVLRPTFGRLVKPGVYVILATPDYDPECEDWAFPPGSVVDCVYELRDGERLLVAKKLAEKSEA